MDMKEARTVVKAASNMVRAFARLDEVLEAAIVAESLTKEREAALAAVGTKLDEANAAYAQACETHGKLLDNMRAAASEMERKAKERMEAIERQVADAEAAKVAAIAVARTKQADAEHEVQSAIDFLTARKAELEKAVAQLEKDLGKLKSKAAAL